MLHHLYIRNYALFSEVAIDIPAGLVILTGETGAGKSLLVGALGLIMGKRADSSVVFREEEKCVVEARFHQLSPATRLSLKRFDDFDSDEEELIIRREISPSGKSRAFINDTPVTLDVLKEMSALLVDLHSQNENQSLLNQDKQRELLDIYADNAPLLDTFALQLKTCDGLRKEIKQLREQEKNAKQQLEYLKFQQEDLMKADIKTNEEQELEEELQLLQHSEEVREAVGGGAEILYNKDESVYQTLSSVLEPLKKVRTVSASLEEEVQRLEEVGQLLKESAMNLQKLLDSVESDPERLSFIEQRLATYHQLKMKYGKRDGRELVDLLTEVHNKIDDFSSLEERIKEQEKELKLAISTLTETGLTLEERRLQAKPMLEERILSVLRKVGFEKSRFEVAVERQEHPEGFITVGDQLLKPQVSGFNRVFFMIQTNPGMPAGPLAQVASGGEVSRVMLAIKSALADKSEFPVLIFDEIDTGISGEIANKVGQVMQQLAERIQILSITHLPQIAAKGQSHFFIKKVAEDNMTTSTVEALSHDQRIIEIAKMLSGEEPTTSALENARELLQQS
ncbi:MAG: DNA repair protein RecN [Bacteroidia bacterium]|nr:DNA repair protein RecN [Bacteroidia bacterium]